MSQSHIQTLQALLSDHYHLVGTLTPLNGEIDLNFKLHTTQGDSFLVKLNAAHSTSAPIDLQNALLLHLAEQDCPIQYPQLLPTTTGHLLLKIQLDQEVMILRVFTWLEGRLYAAVQPKSSALLANLGAACAHLSNALAGFNHPTAHRSYWWNPSELLLVEPHLPLLKNEDHLQWIQHFMALFRSQSKALAKCPKGVNHNDLNDYNIIVSDDQEHPNIIGFIDFGDAIYTHRINELAITLAYALMDKARPIEAALPLIEAYHKLAPLQEEELAVLLSLIAARLIISLTTSTKNLQEQPENTYLQVSNAPAWRLLEQLYHTPPAYAHYAFRAACGMEPCPKAELFRTFVQMQKHTFEQVVPVDWKNDAVCRLDLSVGSLDLGNNPNFEDDDRFEQCIWNILARQQVSIGVGGYGEIRPFYTTDNYLVMGNEGPQWRTVHLGLDIWMAAQTPVYAPLAGTVHAVQDNAGDRDYGPTIILEHQLSDNEVFYTLYGHLSPESLGHVPPPGTQVTAGQHIAWIGGRPENGNWPPHLHFQIMLDLLDNEGDFPGVAFPTTAHIWKSICPDPNLLFHIPQLSQLPIARSKDAIVAFRKAHLGYNMSISYHQHPLKVVRAFRQYLYEADGRRYLDTVNNVPHVGHQHPKVVEAAQRQLAVLNTNTRYLHDSLIDYTEQLLATFPKPLEVAFFVTSGSEANELALRLAQAYSRQQDMLVLEAGYHGHTSGTVNISSYKFDGKGGQGAADHIHTLLIPDLYRGHYRANDPKAVEKYVAHFKTVISDLQRQGKGIAGFIHESILSCGGQIVLPKGYLQAVYPLVRAAGGLCIADEVQVGFGRVGEAFWGFELQGVVPDIVTLGKPIGNGHPMGAVITTKEVASAFANGMEFFSTFGGNPVSCEIGKAVLEVIREEGLQAQALEVGHYLKSSLRTLQQKYPIIGEVRGHGLFLGFELMKGEVPAAAQATYLANQMRRRGILMSTDGPDHNVLKIKPPMCFTKANADFLVEQLEVVLGADFMGW
ncbi:MAG: aminotransferase class III-fold pyridoxal phosphate-dependent enzyme [Bacteroidota bacterium]